MVDITFGIHTGSPTRGLALRTIDLTFAVGTKLTGCTFDIANSAVGSILEGVNANAPTIQQTRWTFTCTGCTFFAAVATDSTRTTVGDIALEVGTRTVTHFLLSRTRDQTSSTGTDFSGFAGFVTGSAVIAIHFRIHTYALAVGQTSRTSTLATGTDLSALTWVVAFAAVFEVDLEIKALQRVVDRATVLARRTRWRTLALVTHLSTGAFGVTGSAVIGVGLQVDANLRVVHFAGDLHARTSRFTQTLLAVFSGFAGVSTSPAMLDGDL